MFVRLAHSILFSFAHLVLAAGANNAAMPQKKARRKVSPLVAAVVRPVSTRLSRMEDLLIEMRAQQDVKLKKINKLQEQFDELTEAVRRKRL